MHITTPGSHLDHMLRQTRMHHIQLSTMADMKANILLTTSTVVITLSVGYISSPGLKLPTINLIVFCLLTIVLATYSVMPHLPVRLKRRADIRSNAFNILFFGDFAALDYDSYHERMEEVMATPGETYDAQVREIYLLGVFLARKKYRFLRLAYISLILGFVSSVALLLISQA